ncbi:site-specific integrase [Actinomadura sp. DC4]|uniref:tyrosine-type recombinase/integrase n=1 Tax=Actinomadura sp. DC4 TaxID=3055069 RepID=UPI0025AFE6E5|nr:site-specific integrase [Actinomadura sp. DC4]MDN3351794.1 site-specific integrase [Actinomadura sp. DC4]
MRSHDVRFWGIKPNKVTRDGKTVVRSHTVRWTVAGREKSKTFTKKALATRHLGRLNQAADNGEAFDVDTGLPDSMARERSERTRYTHACEYIDHRWPDLSAKGRLSVVEGLVAVTVALVKPGKEAPDAAVLRRALRKWAFNTAHRDDPIPEAEAAALRWIAKASVALTALDEERTITKALSACAHKLDGKPAAAEYYRRRRRALYGALKWAVREKRLSVNLLDDKTQLDWRPPEVVVELNRRRVPNPVQVRALLDAIKGVGETQGPRLVALFACMYYAMLRPSEAMALTKDACHLPNEGWGYLEIDEAMSDGGREWTDDGEVHEKRGLKGRPRKTVRRIPIPPALVKLLREHLAEFGTDEHGRLFRTVRGGVYQRSTLWQVLDKARSKAFTPAQIKSLLARKPYDFRHAGVSLRLNAGTPPTNVAEWAGHSVEILQRVYAHCLDGHDERWFDRIDAALVG